MATGSISGGSAPADASAARLSWVTAGLATAATGLAGQSATHGGKYMCTNGARHVTGARFWCVTGIAVKIVLWDGSGNLLTSKTVTTVATGAHVIAFASPIAVNAHAAFTISLHDTAGSGWQYMSYASSGVTMPTSNAVTLLGPYLASANAGLYGLGPGDVFPTTSLNGATVIPVEPLLDTDIFTPTD